MRGPLSSLSLLLILLFAAGCAGGGLRQAPKLSASETDQVLEAVYRYQLAHGARPETGVLCLYIPSGDPPATLLQRFAGEPRPAVAYSACKVEEGRIVERATGKTALALFIANVRPLPSGDVEVEGWSQAGRLSSSSLRYRVVRKGTGWKVTRVREARHTKFFVTSKQRTERPELEPSSPNGWHLLARQPASMSRHLRGQLRVSLDILSI
jgi:hypothetical protein